MLSATARGRGRGGPLSLGHERSDDEAGGGAHCHRCVGEGRTNNSKEPHAYRTVRQY